MKFNENEVLKFCGNKSSFASDGFARASELEDGFARASELEDSLARASEI